MTATLPEFARINPKAMTSAREGPCEICGEAKVLWSYLYHSAFCCATKDVFHELCDECARLCGSGTRWKYVGGGEIKTIFGRPCRRIWKSPKDWLPAAHRKVGM